MNNAVFGKTMEIVRKRANIKPVIEWTGRYGAEALIAKPNFEARSIFDENLVAIKLGQVQVLLNTPFCIGFCVLDLSKTCVYEFYYNFMRKIFGNDCKIFYTDTHSLIYEIKDQCPYVLMRNNIDFFDTSDYPSDNQFNMPLKNKKVVGLMKDECNGKIITKFVGLRSKMYSLRINRKDLIKKAKGVKIPVVRKIIEFDDCVACLYDDETQYHTQYLFRSHLLQIRTIKQTKLALSPFDDKRCLLPDSIDTLPYGHY